MYVGGERGLPSGILGGGVVGLDGVLVLHQLHQLLHQLLVPSLPAGPL